MSLLTICIPTYKRPQFLAWTLERTHKDFPSAALVISDNDNDIEVAALARHFGAEYIGRHKNIGPFPNLREVLLAADTKYCCYLGDDDYLLPDEVQKGIDFLEANPDVVAYYAPCQLWDEISQESVFEAFYVSEEKTFGPDQRGRTELWNFLHMRHVWPEHAIYRRDVLDAILANRGPAYWCFTDLANAIKAGPVHFAAKPYYRNITRHPVGHRMKLGDQQCLTEFDSYRAGLEVLAFDLFEGIELDPKVFGNINLMIRQFIWVRIEVAARILLSQGRHAEAVQYQKRLAVTRSY
jgi:glycosyltransferase involved in cell wall biosynthesis